MDARSNLDRHLRGSKRLDLTGLAWDHIREYPLRSAEVRCLTYMMDIESHTIVFLRDLLATRAVEEPELTAFLACWVYEELWHGEALSRFLGEAAVQLGPDAEPTGWDDSYPSRVERIGQVRAGRPTRGFVRHVGMMLGSAAFRDIPAVHMTWGAINELSTLTAYERLVSLTDHPVLADLLRRIIRDERRHYSFYRGEAERRLEQSRRARCLARVALDRAWAIVGTGVRPLDETDFVVCHLFGDAAGLQAARGMDGKVHSLPGLDGLRLFERARVEAARRRQGRGADEEVRARSRTRRPSRGSGGMVVQR